MLNGNSQTTPLAKDTNISKEDRGWNVDSKIFKRVIGSLTHLEDVTLDIMYRIVLILIFMDSSK